MAASGFKVGRSLYEPDLVDVARDLSKSVEVPLPRDVIVSTDLSQQAKGEVKQVDEVGTDEMILDIGPVTAREWAKLLNEAKTILWNGPLACLNTISLLKVTGFWRKPSRNTSSRWWRRYYSGFGEIWSRVGYFYISTGGGAFLEMIEGKKLPGVEILERKAARI